MFPAPSQSYFKFWRHLLSNIKYFTKNCIKHEYFTKLFVENNEGAISQERSGGRAPPDKCTPLYETSASECLNVLGGMKLETSPYCHFYNTTGAALSI